MTITRSKYLIFRSVTRWFFFFFVKTTAHHFSITPGNIFLPRSDDFISPIPTAIIDITGYVPASFQ